ncbi:glycosyltransferase [Rufibacter ruber]|uniref:glycosyltransferase n=1 Tax=Rufibacter ruber TaxID=1783499 RepID=UPI00082BFDAF|nr:glycosyltransferase [Rufibacter ruber]
MAPKVSVCMIAYNHADFIVQAIEGVLMQKTDFPFELIIGEDCSTDATRSIIKKYGETFPEKIRLLLPDTNVGMMKNFLQTLDACKGEYIALCEGDDYWTDELKLQKQVDFLDQNPDFSISFHRARIVMEPSGNEETSNLDQPPVSTIKDLFRENFIFTATCLFRNHLVAPYPAFLLKAAIGDWPLHILNAHKGKIGFLPEVMATYRVHSGGAISTAYASTAKVKTMLTKNVATFQALDAFLNYSYHKNIQQTISGFYLHLVKINLQEKNKKEAVQNSYKALQANSSIKRWAVWLFLTLVPGTRVPQKFLKI